MATASWLENPVRQRPGHAGGGPDDEQDRTREGRCLNQHGVQPPPRELAVDQEPGNDRIRDAESGNLGCGRDAFDHRCSDDERKRQGGQRNEQAAADLTCAGSAHVREVFATVAPPNNGAECNSQHRRRQHTSGEQRRDRDASYGPDGDQDDARRNRLSLGTGGRE
jgi:hypothetical protein